MTPVKALGAALSATAVVLMSSLPSYAVDVNSTDYIPAPTGATVALSYTTFTTRSSFKPVGGAEIKDGTKLNSLVETLRFVHYMDVGGFTVAPQVLLPFGGLFDGKLGGAHLDSAKGMADPILAAPVWLLNDAEAGRYFAITPYLFVPLGAYDAGETLNLGENRWKFDMQAGYVHTAGPFTLQLNGDVVWYGANKDAVARGSGRLTQDETYQFQGWLSYAPPSDSTLRVALGYSKLWGGEQKLDGVSNGSATKADQIRFEVSKFLTPDFQVLGLLQHDLDAKGSFREDLRATIRLLKVL